QARLGFKRKNNELTLVVKKVVDLDLNGFTRRTAVTGAGSEKSACLLFGFGFDAPFLDPRNQHLGVEQAGVCLRRSLRDGPGRAAQCASFRPGFMSASAGPPRF